MKDDFDEVEEMLARFPHGFAARRCFHSSLVAMTILPMMSFSGSRVCSPTRSRVNLSSFKFKQLVERLIAKAGPLCNVGRLEAT